MKINYIKIYPRKQVTQYLVNINGSIEDERVVPILDGDKLTIKREPLIGDKRSQKVHNKSDNSHSITMSGVESGSLDCILGEQLYPCEYESNEDEVVFWI